LWELVPQRAAGEFSQRLLDANGHKQFSAPAGFSLHSAAGFVCIVGLEEMEDGIVGDGMTSAVDPSLAEDAGHQQLISQYNELAALAGSLAHEIKNPLSVIRMNMDLLAEGLIEAETPRERRMRSKIDMVHDQCTRLENLLNDFLRFTRARRLELAPGSLNELIERVLGLFDVQAREAGVRVLPHLDAALPTILLDAEAMQAALLNLVKNALEAMPNGGVLTVITNSTRNGIALNLIDTGNGLDERTACHMFEAFFSTKEGGSGLGLPTARKIIEAHGGRIGVQSDIGRGTKFTVEFPTPRRL
jgi:signal transduction histidine kinase